MQRISGSTALANANGTGKTGFQDLDLSLGILGTIVIAAWLNAIQEEICTIVESFGGTLDSTNNAQAYQAIKGALNALAPSASPALTGTPTAPTAAAGTSTPQIATTAFVTAAITALVNGAPGALDTLNELATALGDDANFAATVTSALTLKAPLASPALTGTPTAPTAAAGTSTTQFATTAFVTAAILAPPPFRNLLINTDFAGPVNQRGYIGGTVTTSANQFIIDRWFVVTSGQAVSWSSGGLTAPAGGVSQVIEGGLIPRSGTYVISWTGTATATVAGNAVVNGGTVTLTKGTNATVRFAGGTVQSPQIEFGTSPSQWEALPYDVVLLRCKRYYQIMQDIPCFVSSSTTVDVGFPLAITMSTAPTIVPSSYLPVTTSLGTTLQSYVNAGTNYGNSSFIRLNAIQGFTGATSGQPGILANSAYSGAYLILYAEITS